MESISFLLLRQGFRVIHVDAIECSALVSLIKHSLKCVLNVPIPY